MVARKAELSWLSWSCGYGNFQERPLQHGPWAELSCLFAAGSGPAYVVQSTGTDLLSKPARAVAN